MLHVSEPAFRNNPTCLVVFDCHTRKILMVNPSAERFYAYSESELLTKSFHDLTVCPAQKIVDSAQKHKDGAGNTLDVNVRIFDVMMGERTVHLAMIDKLDVPKPVPAAASDPASDRDEIAMLKAKLEQAEAKLSIYATTLQKTEKLVNVGYWEMDLLSTKMLWSDHRLDIFGIDHKGLEAGQIDLTSFVHPDDLTAFEAKVALLLTTNTPYSSVHRIVRPDGEVRYVREIAEIAAAPLERLVVGVTQDITELYLRQAALEEDDRRVIDAGEMAKVGGWTLDARSMMVTRSRVAAMISGEPDRLLFAYNERGQIYAPECRERRHAVLMACLSHARPFDEVMEIISASGQRKWVRFVGKPQWNAGKTAVTGINGVLQDISELVAIQKQSQALNLTLQETLEGISDAFTMLDHDWNFIFINDVAAGHLPRPVEDVIGQNIWELFPEAVGGVFETVYKEVMSSGETRRFKALSAISNRWFSVAAYPTSTGLTISARDVTEEQGRDQQLQLLEMTVESLNDIVLITDGRMLDDLEGPKIVYVNRAFERITGYSREEVIGRSVAILHGPETCQNQLDRFTETLKKSEPVRGELVHYTKNGEPVWMEIAIVPIKTADGTVTHWVSVERDVTERNVALAQIALNEERFRLVAAVSDDVIWDCDLKTDQMWWNDRLFDVFGHDPKRIEERVRWWDTNLHPDEMAEILDAMKSIIDGTQNHWEIRYRFRKADGTYADVIDKGSVIRDDTGEALRIVGSMIDITEQLRKDEQMRQSQKLEAIGQLTGGVAHDFNNLLAIIMGNLELLKEEVGSRQFSQSELFELVDAGIQAVKRGADLTKNLLAYSRKARLNPVQTDINAIVAETERWMRRTIQSNVDITTEFEEAVWDIQVDQVSLQNALVNLLVNARDAMADGGVLSIGTRNLWISKEDRAKGQETIPVGNFVLLRVVDDGDGIDPSIIKQIFDPFFTTKPVGKGSGLGLSMVQGFVRQSGGVVRVHSRPGHGTAVELYFPAVMRSGAEAHTTVPAATSIPLLTAEHPVRKYRILLAEDQKEVLILLKKVLEKAGYDVTPAENGDQALAIFKTGPAFDLIVTDVMMPGELQGPALAKACRGIRADIPFIFLSGYVDDAVLRESDAVRPEDIRLIKPVSRRDFLRSVKDRLMHLA
jgi:PAS domain S-box-containing protein